MSPTPSGQLWGSPASREPPRLASRGKVREGLSEGAGGQAAGGLEHEECPQPDRALVRRIDRRVDLSDVQRVHPWRPASLKGHLPQLIGRGAALDLILSGRLLSADEALRLGLVDAVLERRELLPAAADLIRRWR